MPAKSTGKCILVKVYLVTGAETRDRNSGLDGTVGVRQASPVEPAAGSSGSAGSGGQGGSPTLRPPGSCSQTTCSIAAAWPGALRPSLRPLPNSRLRTVHSSSGSQFTLRTESPWAAAGPRLVPEAGCKLQVGFRGHGCRRCRLGGAGGGSALLPLSSPRGHRASRSTAAGGDGGKGRREPGRRGAAGLWPALPSRGRGQRPLLAT